MSFHERYLRVTNQIVLGLSIAICGILTPSCKDEAKAFGNWLVKDNAPQCNPKEKNPCFCYLGLPGSMTCTDDGQGFGVCECLDSGVLDSSADADKKVDDMASVDSGGPDLDQSTENEVDAAGESTTP
jgi:hypothetical protein